MNATILPKMILFPVLTITSRWLSQHQPVMPIKKQITARRNFKK